MGDKIHFVHLVRSRGGAAKPRNRSLARALYRFFVGAHLQAGSDGCGWVEHKNGLYCYSFERVWSGKALVAV